VTATGWADGFANGFTDRFDAARFAWGSDLDFAVFDNYFFTAVFFVAGFGTVVGVVLADERWSVDRVSDAFGNTLNTTTERMILSLVVVISHVPLGWVNSSSGSFLYTNLFLWVASRWVDGGSRCPLDFDFRCLGREVLCRTAEAGAGGLVKVAGGFAGTLFSYNGRGTFTELVFGSVESGLERRSWTT
jgi:hypothetical protein